MSVNEVAVEICHKISGNLGLIEALDTKGIVFFEEGLYEVHSNRVLPTRDQHAPSLEKLKLTVPCGAVPLA